MQKRYDELKTKYESLVVGTFQWLGHTLTILIEKDMANKYVKQVQQDQDTIKAPMLLEIDKLYKEIAFLKQKIKENNVINF